MAKQTPSLRLSQPQRKLVEREIAAGRAKSPERAVAAGLRLLDRQRREGAAALRDARRKIDEAIDQADRGQLVNGPEAMKAIRARIRKGARRSA